MARRGRRQGSCVVPLDRAVVILEAPSDEEGKCRSTSTASTPFRSRPCAPKSRHGYFLIALPATGVGNRLRTGTTKFVSVAPLDDVHKTAFDSAAATIDEHIAAQSTLSK